MKSKTLKLINSYIRVINEADMEFDPNAMGDEAGMDQEQPDPTEMQGGPDVEDEMPMTSEGENEYISNLIDASLYEPSPEDATTLNDLRSMMDLKKFTNAREEILPTVLNIIRPSTEDGDIRNMLDDI